MAQNLRLGDEVRVKHGRGFGEAIGVVTNIDKHTGRTFIRVYFPKGLPTGKSYYVDRYGKKAEIIFRESGYYVFSPNELIKIRYRMR